MISFFFHLYLGIALELRDTPTRKSQVVYTSKLAV